jgi:hypothetical protein
VKSRDARIFFDRRAPEKLRFSHHQLPYIRFSLSRIETVPFHIAVSQKPLVSPISEGSPRRAGRRTFTIEPGLKMGRQVAILFYVVAMAAVIVGVDFVFFRNRFWERLTVNIGIVLVFVAFYSRFLRRP